MVDQLHSLASRVSVVAREVGLKGRRHVAPAASVLEPCASCGEETAVGSVFFSDRLKIPQGERADAFLCGPCYARIRASQKRQGWTDADVAAFTRNASAAAITWWSRY